MAWLTAALLLTCAQDSVDDLLRRLRSEKIEDRQDAELRLKRLGASALPRLKEAAADKDVDFASRVQEILRSLAKPKLPETAATALAWLPPDTEAVLVAQGGFKLQAPARDEAAPQLERVFQALPSGILATIRKGGFVKHLAERPLVLAMQGGRHFRSPTGLGMMRYSGCQILVFKDDLGRAGDEMEAALKEQGEEVRLQDKRGYRFKEKLEQDEWTLFVARPLGNVLLCATDEAYLTDVLRRMGPSSRTRALPDTLPEWEHVDITAPFWAIRHYDALNAVQDPSSPLRDKAAANEPDAQAVGLAFSWRKEDPAFIVKYFTGNADGLAIARRQWDHESQGLKPRSIEWASRGLVHVAIPNPKDPMMFLFVLLATLGHAIYL